MTQSTSSENVLPIPEPRRTVPETSPWAARGALLGAAVIVPIWSVLVVPLAALSALARLVTKPWRTPPTFSIDSGYQVPSDQIIPRKDRKYDVVVLGATGFTGKLAVRHLCQTYGGRNSEVRFAIAGRSKAKLTQVKRELADELKDESIMDIDAIVVDALIPSTLPALVRDTRAVATTAGPYTYYGSYIVEFCAKFGTHYTDITGEVDWVKYMIDKWQTAAQATGARIIPFCGHDSIPWDLSVYKVQKILEDDNDELVEVRTWSRATGGAPGGTFQTVWSIIDGLAIPPPQSDVDPMLRNAKGKKSPNQLIADYTILPRKCQSPWDRDSPRWSAFFIMSVCNAEVVRWSQSLRSRISNPILQYREAVVLPNFETAILLYVGIFCFVTAMLNPITAFVLRKYILPKSGEGPNMDDMEKKHWCLVSAEGISKKGKRAESHMYFPKDTGCMETSRMLVESALTLALNEEKLPVQGGLWSPAAGMGDLIMERLMKTGTTFTSSQF